MPARKNIYAILQLNSSISLFQSVTDIRVKPVFKQTLDAGVPDNQQ